MGKSQGSKRLERVAIGDPVSDNGISVCDFFADGARLHVSTKSSVHI